MHYYTKLFSVSDEDIKAAAELLKKGEVVGVPTETVYGLAGNALDAAASVKIFTAKGRPQDNPLIVHIADFDDIYDYVKEVPETAVKLAGEFWPGPLTMVLPKKDIIPMATSGGLDTVGIRLPVHETARKLIRCCGFPLAAPSANLSGSPSPTSASHVMNDMNGRIPAIIDGGECGVGVESTVISFAVNGDVIVLRPGFVSPEDIADVIGIDRVSCAKGVTEKLSDGEKVLSPGMKYKHYAPKADVAIIEGSIEAFTEYVGSHGGNSTLSMIFDGDACRYPYPYITYGGTSEEQARELFGVLRELDERNAERVYARCPDRSGVGLAVYNRLLRAAGFEVIKLD